MSLAACHFSFKFSPGWVVIDSFSNSACRLNSVNPTCARDVAMEKKSVPENWGRHQRILNSAGTFPWSREFEPG
jgi:hypothetical protein